MDDNHEKQVILIVASLASFLVPYTGSSISVALPAIGAQFGFDAVMLGWIISAYIISAAVFIVPFGKFSDIIGRKKIFVWGVAVFSIASCISSIAPSHQVLFIARFIQGIGGAMLCFSVYLGTATISSLNYPQFMNVVTTAFLVFSGICMVGIFASYARGTIR
jgi:MFS family permease